jgi:hypothetical protein
MDDGQPVTPNPRSERRYGSRSTMALVLGMLGLVVCQLFSPLAWYFGYQELKAIRSGRSTSSDEGIAKVAMILGMIGTILLMAGLVALLFVWYHWDAVLEEIAPYVLTGITHRF